MRVTIAPQAVDDLEGLPLRMQERVLTVFERLERWPEVSGVKSLTGPWSGYSRIRTGDYRVVFAVKRSEIVVVRIAHRRDVYE